MAELRGFWTVIVSVRTFDARKSGNLLELFPNSKAERHADVPCRHFVVPPLQMEELEQAFAQLPPLKSLYESGSSDIRRLLTIPFHLWLVQKILQSGVAPEDLSRVTSEVQLLDSYWDHRLLRQPTRETREILLSKVTRAMVDEHTLAVRKDTVYQPEAKTEWDELLSDELLCEPPGASQRVMFSHNILFDYAVSALLLEDEPAHFAAFVAEEPARPLFLRPSLVYHFTRQWHGGREVFWKNFRAIMSQNEVHVRQVVRLVVPAVVAEEARLPGDLQPLLAELVRGEGFARQALSLLLQALRMTGTPRFRLWSEVLRSASAHLARDFAWDLGVVAKQVHEQAGATDATVHENCGIISRNLLRWAWTERAGKAEPWIERLVAVVAIPLAAMTYETNTLESRALLRAVLSITGLPNFPVDCIYRLTDEVENIIPHDPEFVAEVYDHVFAHEERSEEKMQMGGPVLPLISNRQQYYSMCQFQLIQCFPRFLATSPLIATRAAIRSLNAFVLREHVIRYLKEGRTLSNLRQNFTFRGRPAVYLEDGSAIWDQRSHPNQPLEIASHLFEHLVALAEQKKTAEIGALLDLMAAEAQCAFLWKRLLEVGASNPSVFAGLLWPLCLAKPILLGNDTLVELGAFLEHANVFCSEEQLADAERAILAIPDACSDPARLESFEYRRNRLLVRMPAERLVTLEAISLRAGLKASEQALGNRPLFEFSPSWGDFTEDDILRDRGAKPDAPENKPLRQLYEPLRDFENKWSNKTPPEEDVMALVPTARQLFAVLQAPTEAEAPVILSAWTYLSRFAHQAARRLNRVETDDFRFLRAVILEAAKHPAPEPQPERDAQWADATWSPAPRHEAAQTLPWLTHFGPDEEVLNSIDHLTADPVPSVRFLLACELWRVSEHAPELAWRHLIDLAEHEPNSVVLAGVCASLWKMIPRAHDRSLSVLKILYSRLPAHSVKSAFREHLISMITDFAVRDAELWALSLLAGWRAEPIDSALLLSLSGERLIGYLTPQQDTRSFTNARALVLQHLDAVAAGLSRLKRLPEGEWNDVRREAGRQLYDVIDRTISRIFFAADVDPELRTPHENPLNDEQPKRFFRGTLPILEKVVNFALDDQAGALFAPTAHYFMQLLNGFLRYDPPTVLGLAADVVRASKPHGYNLDSLAMKEVVKLVEAILADHRSEIQDAASIDCLLNLLDAFVEAGWPDALQLVWRLDEIYR